MTRVDAIIVVAQGSEEGEIVVVADILRRAGLEALLVSVEKTLGVVCARGIEVKCDMLLPDLADSSSDIRSLDVLTCAKALVIPGGMNGAVALMKNAWLREITNDFYQKKKLIGAIALGPLVLKEYGIDSIQMTCAEAVKDGIRNYKDEDVVVSGNVISSRGLGTAIPFALAMLEALGEKPRAVAADIQYRE